jgi:putative tryptophan/tyrosine transport system substrate-binding protein
MLGSLPASDWTPSSSWASWKALAQHRFDLVLMDVQMPEMDGLEATAAIRAQEQTAGVHPPIIDLTARALSKSLNVWTAACRCAQGGRPNRRRSTDQEARMKSNTRQRHGYQQLGLWVVLLAASALFVGLPGVGAQGRQFRVGVLTPGLAFSPALGGLREGLAQLGYQEGKNLTFMVEDAQGEVASLANRATSIVEAKPDVIFTISTAPTIAAKQATTTIPIVFVFVADPLRSGLVASYASSQNNVTGISTYAGPLSGKRLELLQEIVPGVKRVLVLVAPQESVAEVSFQLLAEAAPKLGIELLRHDVTRKEDLEQRLKAVPKGAVDAIYYVPSNLVGAHIELLIHKAKEDRIPLAAAENSMAERGALIAYGADLRLLGIQAAKLVTKILKGAKPSEMPIQTPEQLLLTINLTTAKAIGLDIPRNILERTDRFVE